MKRSEYSDLAIRLQAVINTAIDGIITIDHSGSIETINESAAQLFQYHEEEIIGKNIKMLMPIEHSVHHDAYISNYTKTREAKIIGIGRVVQGLKRDGSIFPFRLAVSEVILQDRVIFTGVIHDLTAVHQANSKLEELNETLEHNIQARTEELESTVNKLLSTNHALEISKAQLRESLTKEKELNELKGRFVSMASHEFRTPLATIMSSASLISKYIESEQQDHRDKHISRIKRAVNNLTGILNDFLSLGKIEDGLVTVTPEQIHLQDLLNEIIEDLQVLSTPQQRIDIIPSDDYIVTSDRRILKNILFNLISNARKYSQDDSVITCNISLENASVVIKVSDTGIGIPLSDQKHLFTRFFRAKNAEHIQGTGLGLHIVKRYVDMINGSIAFVSKQNTGSTFTITLPQSLP